jgi:hypothetical protein
LDNIPEIIVDFQECHDPEFYLKGLIILGPPRCNATTHPQKAGALEKIQKPHKSGDLGERRCIAERRWAEEGA